MIINSIKLKNFRSYEDETEFSFSPKENKNIVLDSLYEITLHIQF